MSLVQNFPPRKQLILLNTGFYLLEPVVWSSLCTSAELHQLNTACMSDSSFPPYKLAVSTKENNGIVKPPYLTYSHPYSQTQQATLAYKGGGYRPHIFYIFNGIHMWQIAQARTQVLIAGAKVFRMFTFFMCSSFFAILCFMFLNVFFAFFTFKKSINIFLHFLLLKHKTLPHSCASEPPPMMLLTSLIRNNYTRLKHSRLQQPLRGGVQRPPIFIF